MEVKGWLRNINFRIGKLVQLSRKTKALGVVKSGLSVRSPQAICTRSWRCENYPRVSTSSAIPKKRSI